MGIGTLLAYSKLIPKPSIKGAITLPLREVTTFASFSGYNKSPFHDVRRAQILSSRLQTSSFSQLPQIPHLPILESLKDTKLGQQVARMAKEENPYLVVTLHGFRTNATLLKFLFENLNFKPERTFVADKFYSTSPNWELMMKQLGVRYYKVPAPDVLGGYNSTLTQTLIKMWEAVNQQVSKDKFENSKIVVISDGGDILKLTPPNLRMGMKIAGVEQTTSGLKKIDKVLYPITVVGASAGKRVLEPTFIAEDIFFHVRPYLAKEKVPGNKTCGIIGNGIIGTALAKHLINLGFQVICFDKNPHAFDEVIDKIKLCESVPILLENCDYVFGCTGGKVFTENNIDPQEFILSRKDRGLTFFSCSSSIIEWEDIIFAIRHQTETGIGHVAIPPMIYDIKYTNPENVTITIANMGYPINFNRNEETIPAHLIGYTRALMAIGTLQAYVAARTPFDGKINRPERLCLDSELQKYITEPWLREQKGYFTEEILKKFSDEKWITEKSQFRHASFYPSFSLSSSTKKPT